MALRAVALILCLGCQAVEPEPSAKVSARIVSLSPALTDTVIALGQGSALVGLSRYCSAPKGGDLPRLGGVQDAPTESVLNLKPTLVLTSDSVHGPAKKLRLAGLEVASFSEGGLADILGNLEALGRMIGQPEQGKSLRLETEKKIQQLRPKTPAENNRALLVFSSKGEPVRQLWAAGPNGWLGELLVAAGFENVLVSGPSYAQLSTEALLVLKPDLIIELNGSSNDQAGPISKRWGAFKSLPAVRNQRLHRLSGEALLRPGPRIVELAESLADLR